MRILIVPVIEEVGKYPQAVNSWPADATIIPIPAGDIEARWRVTEPFWAQDDLWFIEQDNILLGRERESFEQCPEIWCLYQYYADATGNLLFTEPTGCARFRKQFMELVTLERIFSPKNYGSCWRCDAKNPRCYAHFDGVIAGAAWELELRPHVHGITGHRSLDNPYFKAALVEEEKENPPEVTCTGGVNIKPPGAGA